MPNLFRATLLKERVVVRSPLMLCLTTQSISHAKQTTAGRFEGVSMDITSHDERFMFIFVFMILILSLAPQVKYQRVPLCILHQRVVAQGSARRRFRPSQSERRKTPILRPRQVICEFIWAFIAIRVYLCVAHAFIRPSRKIFSTCDILLQN